MSIFYPEPHQKVLLLENIHPRAATAFEAAGYHVQQLAHSLSPSELIDQVSDVSILGIRSKTKITTDILDHAPQLKAIGAFCIGTDQIDLMAAMQKGVCVFNAPYSSTRSVVELTLAEMICLLRGAFDRSMKLHQGIWDKSASGSFEVRGKKLGIIGFGTIGSQLALIAESLGMEVYFYDVAEKPIFGRAHKCATLAELLQQADIITLHVDGNPVNHHLIGAAEFEMMRDGVIFLNLSRGFVVDIDALAANIKSGKVRGAAIDVYPQEPKSNTDDFVTVLQGLPNVILTPHIGGSTQQAQENIADFVAGKIINFMNTGNTDLSVNFPNLQLSAFQGVHRLIHIHENTPGILAQIDQALAARNINIVGQHLKTNETIGYVITDVTGDYNPDLLSDLERISHTIQVRVLY